MFVICSSDSDSYITNVNQKEFIYSPLLQDDNTYSVISPKFTEEVNKAGCVEFTLPASHWAYGKLSKLKTTVYVHETSENSPVWCGRILHDEKDFCNRKSIYAEGSLAFLNDSISRPYEYKGSVQYYLKSKLADHNTQVGTNRQIKILNIGTSPELEDPNRYIVRSNSAYTSTFEELNDKLLKNLGGYFRQIWNGSPYIRYVTESGDVSDRVIMFGENLLDISEYITAENIFTILIPLGAKSESEDGSEGKRLTIESVNSGLDYLVNETAVNLFGKIWKTAEWDDVTIASNLRTKGREFLNQNIEMSVTLSIKAVDLHYLNVNTKRIKIGDSVRVVSPPHGLDAYFTCTKIVHDLEDPSKDEFTLGVGFGGLTDKQIEQEKMSNNAWNIAEGASSSVGSVTTQIAGNYVSKSEFTSFQTQINNNFSAVNSKLSSVFHYKGNKDSESDLPTSGNVIGDVWNVRETGANYAWNGSEWDKLSENIDLSGYVTKEELPDVSKYIDSETFDILVARVEKLEKGVE